MRIGLSVLESNQLTNTTNGIKNIAIGNFALNINTQGHNNLAIGESTLPGLAFILKLKPITYQLDITQLNKKLGLSEPLDVHSDLIKEANREKESEILCGFIAQDVKEIADSLNFTFSGIDKPKNENDIYSLRYAEFVVPLVKAIQELNAEVEK